MNTNEFIGSLTWYCIQGDYCDYFENNIGDSKFINIQLSKVDNK